MLLKRLQCRCDIGAPCAALLFSEFILLDGGLELVDLSHTRMLVGIFECGAHLAEEALYALCDGGIGHVDGPLAWFRCNLCEKCALLLAECLDGFLAEGHSSEHILFSDLLRSCFDHGDIVCGARDGELEIGVLILFERGVDDEFASLNVTTDANAGSWAIKGSAGAHECSRSTHDRDAIGQVLAIEHERGCNDVDFLFETVGKTRTDRTVDHASSEDAVIGGLCFALQVATRDATDRIHLLDEVYGEREEIVILFGFRDNRRYEHGGVSLRDHDSARCLFCKLASRD